jgi:hypothetical protein
METARTVLEYVPLPLPPWEISIDIAPTLMEAISGEFAIQTYLRGRYLTAVGGGGKSTDVIHTDAIQPRAWETFKFWVDSATRQYYAFQTVNGHFIVANNAGGLTTNTILSTASAIGGWEMFKLLPQGSFASHAIQTLGGYLLTAVGGGGHNSGDTIHTDAVNAGAWEFFHIFRRGDLGTRSTYGIQAWGGNVVNPWLTATAGGRLPGPTNALTSGGSAVPYWLSWTLLKQDDGTYAFQTASGGILTANGGGLPGEGFRTDTETDQIGNWEKFTLVDNGDFTAYIKTNAGTYLSANGEQVETVLNVNAATRWRFWVVGL